MRKLTTYSTIAGMFTGLLSAQYALADLSSEEARAKDALANATQAAEYAIPLIENNEWIKVYACGFVPESEAHRFVGFNAFYHERSLLDARYTAVVSPNVDTLYGTTVLDLRTEPMVLTVPPTAGRFFVHQLMNIYTDNNHYVGTRTTGNNGGSFLLAGPDFDASTLKGQAKKLPLLRFTSPFAIDIYRILVNALVPGDTDIVHALQDQQTIQPLSVWSGKAVKCKKGGCAPPPEDYCANVPGNPLDPNPNDPLAYWKVFNYMMRLNQPINPWEVGLFALFREAHLGPDVPADELDFLPDGERQALQTAITDANAIVAGINSSLGENVDGWIYNDYGDYGDPVTGADYNYINRAVSSYALHFANAPEEGLYIQSYADTEGDPLDAGSYRYVLRFPKGELPPVSGFWSLTMYELPNYNLYDNGTPNDLGDDRYRIRLDDPEVVFDDDGSLSIYIQHEAPLDTHELANWLPAPDGEFALTIRAYGPDQRLLDGEYRVPVLETR